MCEFFVILGIYERLRIEEQRTDYTQTGAICAWQIVNKLEFIPSTHSRFMIYRNEFANAAKSSPPTRVTQTQTCGISKWNYCVKKIVEHTFRVRITECVKTQSRSEQKKHNEINWKVEPIFKSLTTAKRVECRVCVVKGDVNRYYATFHFRVCV